MKKFCQLLLGVLSLFLFFATCIGIGSFLPFDNTGFWGLLLAIGSILLFIWLCSNEEDKKIEGMLNIADMIYSLDYSNLKNIKKIEMSSKDTYFVVLKNVDDNDFKVSLNKNFLPTNQDMLIKLDGMYSNVKNSKI